MWKWIYISLPGNSPCSAVSGIIHDNHSQASVIQGYTVTRQPPFPAAVFKAYDIRGTVPDQLNAAFAHSLGLALAQRARSDGVSKIGRASCRERVSQYV